MSDVVKVGRVHVSIGRPRLSRVKIHLHKLILELIKVNSLAICFIYLFLYLGNLAITFVLFLVLIILLVLISYNIFEEALIIILSLLHVVAEHVFRQTLVI